MYYYELWDTETSNLVADFDDGLDALAAIREMSDLETLALARRDERGNTTWLARGARELERLLDNRTPVA